MLHHAMSGPSQRSRRRGLRPRTARTRGSLLLLAASLSLSVGNRRGCAFHNAGPPARAAAGRGASPRATTATKPNEARAISRSIADWSLRWRWGGNSPDFPDGDGELLGPAKPGVGEAVSVSAPGVPLVGADESSSSSDGDERVETESDEADGFEGGISPEEDDRRASRRSGPWVWATVRGFRERRRARVVDRKLHRARRRFAERHSPAVGGAVDAYEEIDLDADDDECFLLPGWRDDRSSESACRDQLPIEHGEIKRVPYVHGGYFGAAPFMLTNPKWTSMLRTLMPDVYVEISRRASKAPAPRLIHWAENNPVVAAYGTAYEMEFSGEMPILEWDVFLNPQLVRGLKKALREREDYLQRGRDEEATILEDDSAIGTDGGYGEASDERRALSDYDEEIERRTTLLVEGMLIAHGNTRQIITEQTGILKRMNFSSVRRTKSSLGGGVFARQWLAVYSEAVRSGADCRGDEVDGGGTEGGPEERGGGGDPELPDSARIDPDRGTTPTPERPDAASLRGASASARPDASIPESISALPAPVRLVLDLKSRHVSRRVWALVIDYLRDAGARVDGIASFNVSEMRDTTRYCSSPVNEIFFLHSAGDMQHCCHSGQIKRGDRVFFNAGSLFWDFRNAHYVKSILRRGSQPCFDEKSDAGGYRLKPYARIRAGPGGRAPSEGRGAAADEGSYSDDESFAGDVFARESVCSTIQDYKDEYDLSIGLYVQECAIDEATLSLIVKYVNSNLHVYDLGLSWGGINGLTVKGIQPGRFSVTDGLRSQRFVSVPWKKDLHPGSSKQLPMLGFVKKVLFH